jgi:gliding motility-associated-like protein
MKRKLLTIITLFLFATSYSQVVTCAADAFAMEDTITCNDSTLIIIGETGGGETFDCIDPISGAFTPCDDEWNTNPGVDFSQPYIPSPDGNGYLWMGSQISSQIGTPRTVTSPTYNTTCGGSICFDFVFADGNSGQAGDNEQPDLYDEGIELQYSVAGGPWIPINYWAPNGDSIPANTGNAAPSVQAGGGPFEVWQDDMCIAIPPAAQATQVRFRFEQFDDSGTCCDHWGIDDINVSINANTMDVFLVEPTGTGLGPWTTPDTFAVSPTADSTAYIFYMNDFAYGGTLQIFDTVIVFTHATDAGPDVTVSCSTIGVELSVDGVMPYSNVVWSPANGLSGTTVLNPWANPVNDQMYTVTSDCGVDSTFVNVVPIFEAYANSPNDSICVNDVATLVATSNQPAVVYTYEWTNYVINDSVATTIVTPSINTTYYVEMVSDSGCVRTDSVTIFVGAVPKTINYLGDMRICRGDSTQITVDAIQPTIFDDFDNNGSGINQGIWSDIQNGTANNDCGSVSALNALHFNGVGDRYAATIPLTVLPSGGTISFDIIYGGFASTGTSCNFVSFNEDVEFQYSIDGGITWILLTTYGAFPDFTWTSITEVIPAAAAGPNTIFRVVQPTHSGNDSDNWAIDNFLVELDCAGLGCVNYEYIWSPAATVSNPNILNPFFFPDVTTTYSLSISPEGFNCNSAADMITIEVDELDIVTTPEDTFLCEPSTVLLNAEIQGYSNSCDGVYNVSQIPLNSLSGAGTNVSLGDDAMSSAVPIPFNFEFFCEIKSSFAISSNGFLSFTSNDNGCCSGENLPTANNFNPNDLIALMWSDLNPNNGGTISHFVTGTTPNRVQVIQFTNIPHFGSSGATVTGQIQMFETSNIVEIHCTDCQTDGGIITMGIENSDGTAGYTPPVYNATSWSSTNEAWRFIPSNSPINYNINWTPNTNITATDVSDPLVTPLETTDYVIEITNINNCLFTDTATVHVYESNVNITANPAPACVGTPIQLMATGANSFTWTPATDLSSTSIANPISTTTTDITYFVEFNTNGCIERDSINIDVIALPTADINNATNPVEFCEDETATLSIPNINGWTYGWTGSIAGPTNENSVEVTEGGSYTVFFNDGTCANQTSVLVQENAYPTFDFSSIIDTILCCEDDSVSILFSNIVTGASDANVQWIANNSGNALVTNNGATVFSNTQGNATYDALYTLIATSDANCVAQADLPIISTRCANGSFNGADTVYSNTTEIFDLTLDDTNASNTSFTWTTTDPATSAITNVNTEDAAVNGTDEGLFDIGVSIVNTYGDKVCPAEVIPTQAYEVIEVQDPQYPDAFTPKNGDNVNNLFRPVISTFASIKDFRVYNRWGQLVYDMSTADNKEGWDGTWNDQDQEADLYIYYMTIEQPDKDVTHEGTITLIR